jgi:ribosomal protein S18 acetylase RimI-like enzyme
MKIRIATPGDEKLIDAFDEFKGNRPTEISRNEVWVAEIGKDIAGYITFNHTFYRKPFIKYLNTNPKYERQGIAESLVKYIENLCIGKKLFISTEADNFPMLRFFEKNNYRLVGMVNEIQAEAEVVFCKDVK